MTTAPDIPVIRVPAVRLDGAAHDPSSTQDDVAWVPVSLPKRGRAPIAFAVCGTLAGVAALALAGAAILAARDTPTAPAAAPPAQEEPAPAPSATERSALGLLSKPSTERVVFQHSGGRLVLAVGSGGRAALLVRGLSRAPTGSRYYVWRVVAGRAPVTVARFAGTERVVFLPVSVLPGTSVLVTTGKRVPPPARRLVAVRS